MKKIQKLLLPPFRRSSGSGHESLRNLVQRLACHKDFFSRNPLMYISLAAAIEVAQCCIRKNDRLDETFNMDMFQERGLCLLDRRLLCLLLQNRRLRLCLHRRLLYRRLRPSQRHRRLRLFLHSRLVYPCIAGCVPPCVVAGCAVAGCAVAMSLRRLKRRLSLTFRGSRGVDESLSELAEHLAIDENGGVKENGEFAQ